MMLSKLIELKQDVSVTQGFLLNNDSVHVRAATSLLYRDSH